jgi:hypothetical protein
VLMIYLCTTIAIVPRKPLDVTAQHSTGPSLTFGYCFTLRIPTQAQNKRRMNIDYPLPLHTLFF